VADPKDLPERSGPLLISRLALCPFLSPFNTDGLHVSEAEISWRLFLCQMPSGVS